MTAISRTILVWSLLTVVACGGANEGGEVTSAQTDPDSTAQTAPIATDAHPDTTVAASTTSQPSASSAAPTTTSTIALTPTLDDGRPATYMAVTADYEAVEVDTATGAVVHRFGQRADAAALESGDETAPNVVDGIWRSASGEAVLISECCEPAGGRITFLLPDGTLDPDYGEPAWHGWWVVPAAASDQVIITGYFTQVVNALQGPGGAGAVTLFENDGSGVGAIGWSPDGSSIHWYDESAGELVTWTGLDAEFEIESTVPIDWVGPDQHLSGLDAQASGNIVSFLTLWAPDGEPIETEGVVYSPQTGGLLAEFEVPAGSAFGGYDRSGRFLIYTTPAGAVMYQGIGRVGVLGEGYLFASW
jgi:sugar lactone lactonase YvrE